MYVTKRDGKQQPVSFDKITERIAELTSGSAINCGPLSDKIQPIIIAQKVCAGVFPGVTTMELDDLAAETACYMSTDCPEYSNLAARIAISNLHKQTDESFFSVMTSMRNYINPKTNKEAPLICEPAFEFMTENAAALDAAMKYERDFTYDFFAYKTLERSYLSKLAGVIVERPQHMIMRVACGIHGKGASGPGNLELVLETYELMSQKWFTHASPTLFNACSPMPQLSSCFLLSMVDDSIEGIYETLKRCALISKTAGGIGLALHVRNRNRNRPQPAPPRQLLTCSAAHARVSFFALDLALTCLPLPLSFAEHPRGWHVHLWHQRHLERYRADAARLQPDRALRQPGASRDSLLIWLPAHASPQGSSSRNVRGAFQLTDSARVSVCLPLD
jgi:hypothetical protein